MAFILTGTGFTSVAGAVLLDREGLLRERPDARFLAHIVGMFTGPVGGVIRAILGYVHADGRVVTFATSELFNAEAHSKKIRGRAVDITSFVRRPEPIVLAMLSRSEPAGGEIDVPTIVVETDPRGTGFS